jgi:hypothetical protein
MVVDAQAFTPGQAPPSADLLWIAEQVPGFVRALDVTPVLVAQGYWPSYNIPYIPFIYDISGYPAMAAKYGPSYTYENATRAQLFARNASDAVDNSTVRALLRLNDFQVDPLSGGDPILGAISARGDLVTAKPVAFGGVDTKVVSAVESLRSGSLHVWAESGPTHDQQAPFAWSAFPSFAGIAHVGLSDLWNYTTITVPGVGK